MTDSPSVPSTKVPESGSAKRVKLLEPVIEKETENVAEPTSDTPAITPLPPPPTRETSQTETEARTSIKTPASSKPDTTNKFDMLCDGVLSSITLVQSALADFLAVKDELLLHSIPPTLMAQLAITAGKLYRSTSDMYTPITELVRMVRVYSVPWEEKSLALKKLHTDYETKHKQLNIAIRRLQLLDMQSRRIEREKRIMNWEKLFSKLTSCKGHGRRWKFLIDTFKQKAKLGMEHVHAYIDSIEKRQDEEDEPELDRPKSQSESIVPEELRISSTELDFSDGESEQDEYENDGVSTARATAQTQDFDMDDYDAPSQLSKRTRSLPRPSRGMPYSNAPHTERKVQTKESWMQTEIIGEIKPVLHTTETDSQTFVPQLVDSDVWTHEPEYDWFLNVKVYRPIGFQQHEKLRCSINYQKQFQKTDVYEAPTSTPAKEKTVEPEKASRSKSMIGSKGRNPMGRKKRENSQDEAMKDESFQHLVFKLNEKPSVENPSLDAASERNEEEIKLTSMLKKQDEQSGSGDAPRKRKKSRVEDQIKLAILHGSLEEMLGMATIDSADLQTLEVQLKGSIEETADQLPANFPVYPVKASAKERRRVQTPCGTVRLTFFYTCVHKPFTFDKQTASESINDIVLDLTDIDLRVTKKESLPWNKDYRDRCLSALSLRSSESDKPEMVTRAEFDMLIEQHNQEIIVMQEDFETRIKGLARSVEKLQNDQLNALLNPGRFGSPLHGWTDDRKLSVANATRKPTQPKNKKLANLPKWGSDLPKDFFERLKLFNEESIRRQHELVERVKEEVSQVIERQLAGQYRLSAPVTRAADLGKDVCLPAVFMPTKTAHLYNPRAHSYFHPSGSSGRLRLTQPPSMFQLPPLPPNNRMSVINLFDIRRNFEEHGPTWSSFIKPAPDIAPSQPASVQSPAMLETVLSVAEEEPTRSATF
ncbi:uncharacterized protein [Antedon mediterranea]|uniref:uncharacterized protein isoform X2 n=1 Tax=Antedon mediterranea TaxID=105859 RepID=UPI003AF88F1B